MITVVPTIIPQDFQELERDMKLVEPFVERVQVDVMDGVYTPKPSWPYNKRDQQLWEDIRTEKRGMPLWETLAFEVDMLVEKPEEKIDDWITAGADTLIVHLESTDTLDDMMRHARERGTDVAIALKPSTDIERLAPYIEQLSFVQVMGNDKIGFHGVALDAKALGTIRAVKERFPGVTIGIDIGVTEATAPQIVEAGATRLASGSTIYGSDDIAATIRKLAQADSNTSPH